MKTVWIEGTETAGLINDLTIGFKDAGLRVVSFAEENRFYSYKYSVGKYSFIRDLKKIGLLKYPFLTSICFILISKCFSRKRTTFLKWIQTKVLKREVDFFISVYNLHFLAYSDLRSVRNGGTKIIGYFVGSEIRVYEVFKKHFNIQQNFIGQNYLNESFKDKYEILFSFEKYAHCIFSVPDQMSLASRPYFHLQLPFNLSKFEFKVPLRRNPVVIHCPSNSNIKGTFHVELIVEELLAEGLQFEFRLIQNMAHEDLLKQLTNADILIDELVLHGPGLLSFEAMASGCAVLTKHYDDSPNCFRPPVISVNSNNLKGHLRMVVEDVEYRSKISHEGRKYVLTNNTMNKVVCGMLEKMTKADFSLNGFDYIPNLDIVKLNYLTEEQVKILNEFEGLYN